MSVHIIIIVFKASKNEPTNTSTEEDNGSIYEETTISEDENNADVVLESEGI